MRRVYVNYVYDIRNGIVTKRLHTNMNTKPCIAISSRGRWNYVPDT
jgi:hypothetical protein